jgi:hypothetical protein
MNKILSDQQTKDLNKIIQENNVEDNTHNIKINKHSDLIRNDIKHYLFLSKKYERLKQSNPNQFEMMCNKNCSFIFNNYTNIYNKLIKNCLNLEIMDKFLITLKQIENNEINQHEASYIIGEYLKKIYIDSALLEDKNKNKHTKKIQKKPPECSEKKINYKDFKKINLNKE